MHTLDLEQQRYDSMLPPDNSFMEDAIEEKAAEIIERQGLEWLESRVDLKTWEKNRRRLRSRSCGRNPRRNRRCEMGMAQPL